MVDVELLKIIKNRAEYDRLKEYIPEEALHERTRLLIKDFERYYEDNKDTTDIDMETFKEFFFCYYHRKLSVEQKNFYEKTLDKIKEESTDSTRANIAERIITLGVATDIAHLVSGIRMRRR